MANNLINIVVKVYAGLLVVACLVFELVGCDTLEYTGILAVIGAVAGFAAIIIGELVFEIKVHYRKWKFMKLARKERENKTEEVEVIEEAAQ